MSLLAITLSRRKETNLWQTVNSRSISGLELSEAETAQLSGVIQRAAMLEIAKLSAARGKGVSLNLKTKFDRLA